jgi:tetratricopeptide (TPR) repeat protein
MTSTGLVRQCYACGFEAPADAEQCPSCHQPLQPGSVRLPLIIVVLLIVAVFALTQYFVKLHRQTEADLAQRWFQRGVQAMQAHNPQGAADGFRTALTYDRDNPQYRLRLAEALLESNHLNEARAHLSSLWDEEPADGEVNLQLARLYAKRNGPTEAVRYYRNAINGVWNGTPVDQREAARFELIHYLIQRHDAAQARAELVALQADEPRDVPDQLRLAALFLELGELSRAVEVYKEILANDQANVPALTGLGEALLQIGDYPGAERALASAVDHNPNSAEARQQLELARQLLRVSPALRNLSFAERVRRVSAAYDTAWKRLTSCAAQGYNPPAAATRASSQANSTNPATGNAQAAGSLAVHSPMPADLEVLYTTGLQMADEASERSLQKNPDSLEPVMQYVFQVERATQPVCPSLSLSDQALLLLAQGENESLK